MERNFQKLKKFLEKFSCLINFKLNYLIGKDVNNCPLGFSFSHDQEK